MNLIECASPRLPVVALMLSAGLAWGDDAAVPQPAASASQAISAAIDLHGACAPSYPDAARRAGATGVTRIRFTIDSAGNITEAEVIESSGKTAEHRKLDRIAVATLSTCPIRVGRDEHGNPVGAQLVATYQWP